METEHFFDYFRNYEDDLLRIIGYLAVHLLNEYGGLIEKILENTTFAKIAGYLFKQLRDSLLILKNNEIKRWILKKKKIHLIFTTKRKLG